MSRSVTLTVLVSPACAACAGALAVTTAYTVSASVAVEVVDVSTPGWVAPAGFVGTPMVYLGDTVVSYGTPTVEQLSSAYTREARARDQPRA